MIIAATIGLIIVTANIILFSIVVSLQHQVIDLKKDLFTEKENCRFFYRKWIEADDKKKKTPNQRI